MLNDEEMKQLVRITKAYAERQLLKHEAVYQLRHVATAANVSDVLAMLPADLSSLLADSISRFPALKAVGYWKFKSVWSLVERGEELPDPRSLVRPLAQEAERQQIAAYLQIGRTYIQWRGLSSCRFRCGIDYAKMGSRCLTDGVWVWPEGLHHYVECHGICLPEEFIATMRENRWWLPKQVDGIKAEEHGPPDPTFWIAWANNVSE